jgi:beta-glucosidase
MSGTRNSGVLRRGWLASARFRGTGLRARVYVAGSNADNLGAQAGGWALTWQGRDGAIDDPGTTILKGIEAQDSHVIYSQDASAPTAGSDVGVVGVGEHPYAEG